MMSKHNKLIYSESFEIRGHDVNANKYITIPALLKIIQRCSLSHASILASDIWKIEDDLTWILLQKEMKIIKTPKLGDEIIVLTYPSSFDKFFATRDYLVFDSDKKLIAAVSSNWTMIDRQTRKLAKIPKSIVEAGVPSNTKFLKKPSKIVLEEDESAKVDERKVRPYDLDWNGHLNNIVLLRYCLEPLLANGVSDEDIQRITIHFKNELFLTDVCTIHMTRKYEENVQLIVNSSKSTGYTAACNVQIRKSER